MEWQRLSEAEEMESEEDLVRWTLHWLSEGNGPHGEDCELFKRLAEEMLASDDPAKRRMLGGPLPLRSWYWTARDAWEAERGEVESSSDDENEECSAKMGWMSFVKANSVGHTNLASLRRKSSGSRCS